MGILNVTPDSFSDTGRFLSVDAAIAHGQQLFLDGASIVDVGGEASGPGSKPCTAEEELRRVLPVVEVLGASGVVSVDTTKSLVARRALERGARIINDISGLRYDPDMVPVVRDFAASAVIMYSKERGEAPLVSESQVEYPDVVAHVSEFFDRQISYAVKNGLRPDQLILDPGMGRFVSQNPIYSWEILGRLGEFRRRFAGFRLLLGVSRKGFLGGELVERDAISQLIGEHAAQQGVDILRTHNVRMATQFHKLLSPSAS